MDADDVNVDAEINDEHRKGNEVRLKIESVWIDFADGGETDGAVDGGDDANDDGENNHTPEPVFHTDDFVRNVHIVKWNEGFPAWLAGFFEDAPARDDVEGVENDEVGGDDAGRDGEKVDD